MSRRHSPHDLAHCGVFGAAALLLPVLFHLVHLGRVFMPMYLPLVTLAFFVKPLPAAVTAAATPILSGAVTGMPPFYPPVAVMMAVELSFMAAVVSATVQVCPRINEWGLLLAVLLLGRCLYVALVYGTSLLLTLPAAFMAGVSFVSGWPGIVLMMVVVPPLVRTRKASTRPRAEHGRQSG
ncbi:MAG: hypothetical protein JW940_30150 [Polyangiaceae bacterium]|nr:hypothetical protein [Polyangiaceae bacterium]